MENQEVNFTETAASESPEPTVEALQQELIQLREALFRQEESTQGYLEQIKRIQADFENWRRRVEQEKLLLVENASAVLIEKLLPVLDNFERALSTPEEGSTLREGIQMIYRQLLEILAQEGLAAIETVGHPFDPGLHEAYAYEARSEGEVHQVMEEGRKGYLFKGKTLRPALVKVCKQEVKD